MRRKAVGNFGRNSRRPISGKREAELLKKMTNVEKAELSKEVDFSSAQGSYETRRKGGRFASDTG